MQNKDERKAAAKEQASKPTLKLEVKEIEAERIRQHTAAGNPWHDCHG